jgi:hypothetical protein
VTKRYSIDKYVEPTYRRLVSVAVPSMVHGDQTASTNNETRSATTREDNHSIYSEIQGVRGGLGA